MKCFGDKKLSKAISGFLVLAGAAAVAPAEAVTVSLGPQGPFTATGPITIITSKGSVSCTMTMVGTIYSTGTSTSYVSFSGSDSRCNSVTPTNLPWGGGFIANTSTAVLETMVIAIPGFDTPVGNCIGNDMQSSSLTINTAENYIDVVFNNSDTIGGPCTVTGTLLFTPVVTATLTQ